MPGSGREKEFFFGRGCKGRVSCVVRIHHNSWKLVMVWEMHYLGSTLMSLSYIARALFHVLRILMRILHSTTNSYGILSRLSLSFLLISPGRKESNKNLLRRRQCICHLNPIPGLSLSQPHFTTLLCKFCRESKILSTPTVVAGHILSLLPCFMMRMLMMNSYLWQIASPFLLYFYHQKDYSQ
jgi:hypothetical protein